MKLKKTTLLLVAGGISSRHDRGKFVAAKVETMTRHRKVDGSAALLAISRGR
ncbi:MAG: hypothetical protein KIT73_07470 [Burkholderiales bacterium]|nr:hypothetical protein [Burkholderiales bacterium]